MDKFLNLVLSGAVTGAIYSIMASGLVLTYTTSGIFNFAHGAVAFATAYVYYQLNTGLGLPIVPSLDHLGVRLRSAARAPARPHPVAAAGEGAGLRPDRGHHRAAGGAAGDRSQWLVVTLGERRARTWDLRRQPGDSRRGRSSPASARTPAHVYHPIGRRRPRTPTRSRCFIVAAIAALVLWFVLRRTRVGLEMRAVVDRESLAGLRGINAGPHVGGGLGPDDGAGRPGRCADRAAVRARRLHASRWSCWARSPPSCSAGCGRCRSRSRAACCSGSSRTWSPVTATTSCRGLLAELSGLRSAVPYLLVHHPRPDHRPRPQPPGGIGRRRRPAAGPPRRACRRCGAGCPGRS